jgi:3-hydroxyisobutyrate dehydrogenase-like beta-hydroxyacid dehydrogenase
MKVGFIGLGIMGQPMAKNVIKKGYPLFVYNRTVGKTMALKEEGAVVALTPKEAAKVADAVILMLTGPEALDDVMGGPEGLLEGIEPGKTVINMSTVPPAYAKALSRRLQALRVIAIDAPVSGSRKPAEDGTLVILTGGPEDKVKEMQPLLLTMGKKIIYCGQAGQGASMKMAVNLLLGIMAAGLCEAVNLGQKCGLSTTTMLETMLSGPMECALFEFKKPMLINGSYSPQFPLKHMEKDLKFVIQTADEVGAAVPGGHAAFQLYRQAFGHGLADMDFAAVKKVFEAMSDPSPDRSSL